MLLKFIFSYILPALKKSKFKVILALTLLSFTTATSILSVEASRSVVQAIQFNLDSSQSTEGLIFFNSLGAVTPQDYFLFSVIAMLVLPLVSHISKYFQYLVFELISIQVTKELRLKIFQHILHLPYLRFMEMDIGTLVKRVSSDTKQIRGFILEAGLMRVADLVFALGLLCYLFMLNPALLFVTVICLTIYLLGSLWSARIATQSLRNADKSFETVMNNSSEILSRFIDVKANCRELSELTNFKNIATADSSHAIKTVRLLLIDRSLTGILQAIGPIIILACGGLMTIKGDMSFGTLMAFVATISILYGPINNLSAVPLLIARSGISVNNIASILNEETEEEGRYEIRSNTAFDYSSRLVKIENLAFSYMNSNHLLKIDKLEINKGETVALVGPSGSGKSSLLRLLFGFLHNYQGTIELYGTEIKYLPLETLRKHISIMPQDSCILPDSIFENIAYGRVGEESVTESKVWEKIKEAGLLSEVQTMKHKLETQLDPLGQSISGGQKRRICLGRALLKQPDILLLDEPLTGIGPQDRKHILKNISQNTGDIAFLITTHQQDLLAHVDRVVYLQLNKSPDHPDTMITSIKNIGTHEWLLKNDSSYAAEFN